MSIAKQNQHGNSWFIGAAGFLALLVLLFSGALSLAFPIQGDEERLEDQGVVYVNYAFPPHWSDPSLYIPFRGYRFHPYYTLVDCDIDPEEAQVIVDGESYGEADDFDGFPSYLYLHPGYHRVEFRHQGHRSLIVQGQFKTGAFLRLDRDLTDGSGEDLIDLGQPREMNETSSYADMPEPVPEEQHRTELPPAAVERSDMTGSDAAAPDSGSREGGQIPPLKETPVPADAGLLRLTVSPGDASVYVDDEFFGSGDEVSQLHGYIRLEPGVHSIQIVRPGYHSKDLEVNMISGEKQHLDVWLEHMNR